MRLSGPSAVGAVHEHEARALLVQRIAARGRGVSRTTGRQVGVRGTALTQRIAA
jgi:hypothetical protein